METVLSPIEARVLGCLIEKQMTTPDYYPLTLNSLTAACNQKSNRDPLMTLAASEVEAATDEVRHTHKLALMTMTSGSRSPKYMHTVQEQWELSDSQLALLGLLLVRGPQTTGELRTRSTRLHKFSGVAHVETTLESLADTASSPLFKKCPREPGRRERRWMHTLYAETETGDSTPESTPEPAQPVVPVEDNRIPELETEVQSLKAELDALKSEFAEFRKQFD
jgi:uncharacterized protein YceH (UPF0502 family)